MQRQFLLMANIGINGRYDCKQLEFLKIFEGLLALQHLCLSLSKMVSQLC